MPFFFRAVAVDYDGTLTRQPRASHDALAAVHALRETGRRCILVSGRILEELQADFPDVREHFDAIVAENGAVLARLGATDLPLATPVSTDLVLRLRTRGVPLRQGQVLLATDSQFDDAVYEEIRHLGLDYQLVRNRQALMVLPAGVTKGTGLARAVASLNLSLHSTIGIGDAENDHALLDACELGIAVSNAIDSLKQRADVVLELPDGEGVTALLHRLCRTEPTGVEPRRRVTLGTFADGTPATIPASRVNVAVYGPSGSGKSHIAGLLVEQLLAQAYTVCVLDLEGDHASLGGLHGTVTLGGVEPLPSSDEVVRLLTHGLDSVVVDLSLRDDRRKREYAADLLAALWRSRSDTGLPHWVVIDEAHVPLRDAGAERWCAGGQESGLCVITYRPELICRELRGQADVSITIDADRQAYLFRLTWPEPRPFTPLPRVVGHVRHWHKYAAGQLPPERRFAFRDGHGLIGISVGNLAEFADALDRVSAGVLRHHAAHADFSRWVGDLCRTPAARHTVAEVETAIHRSVSPHELSTLRMRLSEAVRAHATP